MASTAADYPITRLNKSEENSSTDPDADRGRGEGGGTSGLPDARRSRADLLGPFRRTEAVSRSDVRWPERYLQIYQGTCAAFVRRTMHTRRALVLGLLANSISSLSKPERSGSGTATL